MLKIDNNKKYYPVITGVLGLLAFMVVAFLIGLVSVALDADMVFISMLIVGAVGPLILFMLLNMKNNLLMKILASIIGILVGFMVGFGMGYVAAAIIPGGESGAIPNIVALVIMNVIYALVMASVTFGKDAIRFFLLVSAVVGLVLGILFMFLQNLTIAGVDANYLFIVSTFGLTLGLCIGSYKYKTKGI